MKYILKFLAVAIVLLTVNTTFAQDKMMKKNAHKMMKDEVTVIQLAQTSGQYETKSLALIPGKYIFEVTNKNVDKKLGFYLTDNAKTQVANSGLASLVKKGETARTGIVELKTGAYSYNCPLNPTPLYSLTVGKKMMEDKMGDHKMKGDKMMKDKMGDHKAKGDKMMKDKMDDHKAKGDKMMKDKMGDHKVKGDKMMKDKMDDHKMKGDKMMKDKMDDHKAKGDKMKKSNN